MYLLHSVSHTLRVTEYNIFIVHVNVCEIKKKNRLKFLLSISDTMPWIESIEKMVLLHSALLNSI